jgi:hypothetical protein
MPPEVVLSVSEIRSHGNLIQASTVLFFSELTESVERIATSAPETLLHVLGLPINT